MKRILFACSAALALTMGGEAFARDQIKIVGSSTVFPFTTAVAEKFGEATGKPVPVVESNGTGGGFKLFCAGVGEDTPDIANASRRIKKSEFEDCAKNGVTEIIELMVGYDGVALAVSKKGPDYDLSLTQLYRALAAKVGVKGAAVANPAAAWRDLGETLPNAKIEVLGPPPTSGTRDSFAELGLAAGCKADPEAKAANLADKACMEIRADGAWTDSGENDNLIVSKLVANPNALGVFGYSFLEENGDKVKAVKVGGVSPTAEAIASGKYPLSRSLYIYVKKAHVEAVPGLKEFLEEYISEAALGEEGYLSDKGLIPPTGEQEKAQEKAVADLAAMTGEGLH